jgi:tRNA(fMet)-specific endonuclease VapC
MKYLLDTNAWIGYLSKRRSAIVNKLATLHAADVCLCSVVLAELYYGAYKSGQSTHQAANLALLTKLRGQFVSLSFDDGAAEISGRIRAQLAVVGTPIGPHDLQIAAIALAHNLILVTHNTREFGRVPGLVLEDWEAMP